MTETMMCGTSGSRARSALPVVAFPSEHDHDSTALTQPIFISAAIDYTVIAGKCLAASPHA
jgi:hypothetical protein